MKSCVVWGFGFSYVNALLGAYGKNTVNRKGKDGVQYRSENDEVFVNTFLLFCIFKFHFKAFILSGAFCSFTI